MTCSCWWTTGPRRSSWSPRGHAATPSGSPRSISVPRISSTLKHLSDRCHQGLHSMPAGGGSSSSFYSPGRWVTARPRLRSASTRRGAALVISLTCPRLSAWPSGPAYWRLSRRVFRWPFPGCPRPPPPSTRHLRPPTPKPGLSNLSSVTFFWAPKKTQTKEEKSCRSSPSPTAVYMLYTFNQHVCL